MNIGQIFATLTPREEKVLRMHTGIGETRSFSADEIAKYFNVPTDRINQILAKTDRKLSHDLRRFDCPECKTLKSVYFNQFNLVLQCHNCGFFNDEMQKDEIQKDETMNEEELVIVETNEETFRGYVFALDNQIEAGGSVAIPFIAFAKMSGADVDKIFVKADFEKYMEETAAEYVMTVTKHNHRPGSFKIIN